jgi:hypothetical protein
MNSYKDICDTAEKLMNAPKASEETKHLGGLLVALARKCEVLESNYTKTATKLDNWVRNGRER